MRAIFAHGSFDPGAAIAGRRMALAAYGVGLPAMALVRIVAIDFLCPPRHADAGARHCDRHGLQYRAQRWFSSGACIWAWRAWRWARRCGAWINVAILDLVWAQAAILLAIETAVSARSAAGVAGGLCDRRGRLARRAMRHR